MEKNTGAARKNAREERLASALRDNLKRRKAQARERAAAATPQVRKNEVPERKD